MNERYIDVSYDEDNGLRLADAFKAVRRNLAICLLAGIATAAVFLACTLLLISPQYESSFTVYVSNRPAYTEETVYYLGVGDVQAAYSLAKTYAFIFESREMAVDAVRYADLSSYAERANRKRLVSTSIEQDTPLVTVTVTADSPQDAYQLSEAVLSLIPDHIASITTGSSVSVVEPSQVPTKPSSPRKKLNAAIGFVLGFGLSALVAIVQGDKDKTIRDEDELEDRSGVPAFVDARDVLPLLQWGATRIAGIMDVKDASLAASDAIALAESCAALGARTLLIDGDVANAACGKRLGIRQAIGLSDVLDGDIAPSGAVQHLADRGMDFMTSGKHASDSILTVGSARMDSLLATLEREYDCIVIAIPPVLRDNGALVLANRASRAFLSVREGETRKPDVEAALRRLRLADVHIDGFIYSKPRDRAGHLSAHHG